VFLGLNLKISVPTKNFKSELISDLAKLKNEKVFCISNSISNTII